jgi:hypothetical protein
MPFDLFNAVRIQKLAEGVYDSRLMPQPLVWSARIPSVPAFNDEIMARFVGFPVIADLIADDAKALTYSMGKFVTYAHEAPKLKLGVAMNEKMIRQVDRIRTNLAGADEVGVFRDWEARTVSTVRYGVDVRREALLIAMLFDSLNYDRLGIKLSAVNWGMYSDLKVTPSIAWDSTSATPVADVLAVKLVAAARYGVDLNRLTMSTTAFRYAIATTEFQAKARMFLAPNVSYANLSLADLTFQRTVAQNVFGMSIEIDDRRYWSQDPYGNATSQPLWPTAGVAMTDSRMDGNSMAWDWASGLLIESVVSRLAGGQAPAIPANRGTVVWATLADQQVNPPGIVYWGAECGFPRKHLPAVNAALTVGTFADSISTALP